MSSKSPIQEKLISEGYCMVSSAVALETLDSLIQAVPAVSSHAGIRSLANKVPLVRTFAESAAVRDLIAQGLGESFQMIRSILFNKDQSTNWQILWHQDLAIAVKERHDVEGYLAWSIKDGVPHVQPPVEILEQMLTIRVHLDDADEDNGALWVAPGSHRMGRIPANKAAEVADSLGTVLCKAAKGDALLMKPLLLHASKKATSSRPRRVVHLEFASFSLPHPLNWTD